MGELIILLITAVVFVPLFQLTRLGSVPGYLIAGVIIGPYGLGLISDVSQIGKIAEIGVVLLLCIIGIELKPSRLWLMRRHVFGLGTLQVLLSGVVVGWAFYLFFDTNLKAAVLVGPALALSSTAFVLKLILEQKLIHSSYGRTSFAILLFQDLAVVPLLALVPLLSMPEISIEADIGIALIETIFILLSVIVIGRYLLEPVFHRIAQSGTPEIFTASSLLLVLGIAMLAEHMGFSMAMGAFLAGLLISDSSYRHQVIAEIQPFRGLLLGLFFMSMGMSFNLELLIENPISLLVITAMLIVLKVITIVPLSYLFGLSFRNSLAIALVLAQGGEFALVLFSLASQSHLLSDQQFQQLLAVVVLSMVITPLLAVAAQKTLQGGLVGRTDKGDEPEVNVEETPIVIAGFGHVGRRIGQILSSNGTFFVALDSNPELVEKGRDFGYAVHYGDVRNHKVLEAVGASHAQIIIVTINEAEATEIVVESLRRIYPEKIILARGRSLSECQILKSLGTHGVVSDTLEASIGLARMALLNTGVDERRCDLILNEFRSTYQAKFEEPPLPRSDLEGDPTGNPQGRAKSMD